jgi:putative transposase
MSRGYISSETSVHYVGYHFVWCPKYRRAVLTDKIETRLKELIKEKSKEFGCKILALEVMPDHVHLFIVANPQLSPNLLIGQIKGFSSRILRQEFPELKSRLPTLWTRSYFVSTHGHISDKSVQKYIADQKGI